MSVLFSRTCIRPTNPNTWTFTVWTLFHQHLNANVTFTLIHVHASKSRRPFVPRGPFLACAPQPRMSSSPG